MKNRTLCLPVLVAVCFCALLSGCEDAENLSVPSVTASGQISVLASSQDADGYVYEFCNETVYATGDVNIRSAATGSNEIVGVLEKGQSILRTSYNESWSKVEFEGKTCYVASAWLSLNPPTEETTEIETELPAEVETESVTEMEPASTDRDPETRTSTIAGEEDESEELATEEFETDETAEE